MKTSRRTFLLSSAAVAATGAWARPLDAIKKSGKLVAATEGAFTPFYYFVGPKLTGFEG